jgi:hypothetical protein
VNKKEKMSEKKGENKRVADLIANLMRRNKEISLSRECLLK